MPPFSVPFRVPLAWLAPRWKYIGSGCLCRAVGDLALAVGISAIYSGKKEKGKLGNREQGNSGSPSSKKRSLRLDTMADFPAEPNTPYAVTATDGTPAVTALDRGNFPVFFFLG